MAIDGTTSAALVTAINSQVVSSESRIKDALGNEITRVSITEQLDAYDRINAITAKRARTSMMDKIKFVAKT